MLSAQKAHEINVFLTFRECGLNKVRKMYVYNNSIIALPQTLFKMRSLTVLDLSNNFIQKLPDEMGTDLKCLTHLYLRNNRYYSMLPKNS